MRYHERTRRRGVNTPVYWIVRAFLQPFLQIYFRLSRTGRQHIPAEGGVLLAANHRSFLDPFVIGCCLRRPIFFVAKQELFQNRLMGWFLNCMGAFPIRRGESDEESMKTALALLDRGEVVVIFPEGTRIRRGALGKARRGVGRLALQSGAPVVPIAVHGSEHARPRGIVFKPVKVKLRVGRPLTFPRVESPSKSLANEVTARIWPCVELQYEWLGGLPPLRKAAVVGAGSAGTATATLLARAGLEVQLGCRDADHAERIAAAGENAEYLPGVALPDNVAPTSLADIEFAGVDLVVLAVPSSSLPQVVGSLGARIGDRSAVLALSKGLVQPLGTLPTRYVADRVNARAVAFLGGPAHAAESVDRGAHVVLASTDVALRDQLGEVLTKAGLDVERTGDVVGVQLAGAAKNAAALAAAAAATDGMNAAGAAASRVFAEVHELARAHGARTETFLGLAGAGDLVATALAEHSRNRRAGELLGQGVPGDQIPAILPQAAEGISSVPLLVEALDRENIACPACEALCGLIEGRIDRSEWLASVRRAA
jgi:glycerol-3-phosphate dehydrogenase (NAD(P)+)